MFYIFCKVYFWQSVLYGNVRVLQMFSKEVYLLEYFFGGVDSAVLFLLKCFADKCLK